MSPRQEACGLVVNAIAMCCGRRRAVQRTGEDPSRYLLALKYLEALEAVVSKPCTFQFLPGETSFVQVAKDLVGSSVLLHA